MAKTLDKELDDLLESYIAMLQEDIIKRIENVDRSGEEC